MPNPSVLVILEFTIFTLEFDVRPCTAKPCVRDFNTIFSNVNVKLLLSLYAYTPSLSLPSAKFSIVPFFTVRVILAALIAIASPASAVMVF